MAKPVEPAATRCARCGVEFVCGMRAAEAPCWCAALPPLPKPLDVQGCVCRDCLEEALRAARQST